MSPVGDERSGSHVVFSVFGTEGTPPPLELPPPDPVVEALFR